MEATLRFELRKDSINKNGEHPLVLIMRVAGQRKKLPTGIKDQTGINCSFKHLFQIHS